MEKIYSRPRFNIPKFIFYKNKNNSKKRSILIIVFIAFLTLKIALDAVTPIYDRLCENKAISFVTIISNKKAAEIMKKHTYDELFCFEKDEKGNIKMIKANIVPINEITSDVALEIQQEIDSKEREDIEIALR